VKLAGRSVFGVWWLNLGVLELDVARWYFALALGTAGASLWFMVGRDPSTRDTVRRPRLIWVRCRL
jgi:hypothetical protein